MIRGEGAPGSTLSSLITAANKLMTNGGRSSLEAAATEPLALRLAVQSPLSHLLFKREARRCESQNNHVAQPGIRDVRMCQEFTQ